MSRGHFSLILLPTLQCNAHCDYCFEHKSEHRLSLGDLSIMMRKVMAHLEESRIENLSIYWQGGEVMLLPPEWLLRANDIVRETAAARGIPVANFLQSNMLDYGKNWNRVMGEMFGNSVGSSMDYPNLHRRIPGGGPEEYERIWRLKVREAREAGIEVGVIAIPGEKTLEMGAERFYEYFVHGVGIRDFQINTPFPGGVRNEAKQKFPLSCDTLSRFLIDLASLWGKYGIQSGVRIGPFAKLMDYFINGNKDLMCIWTSNCVNELVCIDPGGHVAQCDCWVTSYPEFRFGNIFESSSLSRLLVGSEARQRLQSRPGVLVRREDCLACKYLTLCHGGCPVRAYTVYGDMFRKDPYCRLYQRLFETLEDKAAKYFRKANPSAACSHGNESID